MSLVCALPEPFRGFLLVVLDTFSVTGKGLIIETCRSREAAERKAVQMKNGHGKTTKYVQKVSPHIGLRKNTRRSGETEIVRMWVDLVPVVRFMKGYDGFIQEVGNGGDMPR